MLLEGQKDIQTNGKQIYEIIGCYKTQEEAFEALSQYNSSPYDINKSKVTVEEIYQRWSKEHYPTISDSAICNYTNAFNKYLKDIHKMRFVDLRFSHLQRCY